MKVYVWYWVTALLQAVNGLAGCPDDYQMHGGICYKAFDEENTFLKTLKKCFDDGGTLAMPKDKNTNDFLISLKNGVDSRSTDDEFWFGLVYQHEEGSWQWIDGTPIGNYSAWGSEESSSQGDCARYSSTAWGDGGCSEKNGFICQIILAGCPGGYVYHEPSRVCYRAFDDDENYDDAVAVCSSDGGTLAMPRDTATNNFLIYLKNAVDNSAWFRFGLTELHQEGTWIWADNVTQGNFSAWGLGEPNNHGGRDEDCAEYFPGNHNNKKNKWNDGPCYSSDRKFICQVIPTGCPGGYRMYGGICYKAFDDTETFLKASEKCFDDCGTLAMPKDNNMNTFLISLKNEVDLNHGFWFGLVDQHEEGSWQWIDGTPIGNYSAWGPGEPNNQGNCARYSSTAWGDGGCSEKNGFICQIILAGCPGGYVYHGPNQVCYRAFDDDENYDDAVAVCSSDGGTLAMPRDTATNNFLIYLKNAVDNSAWFRFGLTELHQEGTWIWADNVTLGNFSAWGPGEPNNHGGQDEDCAEYFPGNHNHNSKKNKWNDGLCSRDNRKFICQVIPSDDSATVPSVGTKRPSSSTGPVMEQSTFTSTIMPEVTPNTVLARVNVSLTLTAPCHVNQSLLRDSITQSLKKQAGGLCGNQCQIGEIFLHIVTDTTGARKKRQAGDQVLINVIIQLIVVANQQQGDTTDAVAAKNLLQEKADDLRQLVRDGKLYVDIDGEQVRLVDNNGEKRTPPWLVGVVCAAVVVLVLIAVVTVLLCRRKHSPGINVPGKIGNEMKNLDTPGRHNHTASEGTVDNIIYNTEDEGFVDNVIYNAGDEGTVDNVIYQGENSKSNNQENAPESQYETVN
ncbi:macrophage mannose receptor 1-like [Branchiostoma floridae x Branchiostoma belcheri]